MEDVILLWNDKDCENQCNPD
uniref:Uncharacterized protein n=1 Tax=Tetranychus urticae TaxID=32264 RepID=T1KM63_TETUR